MNKILTIVLCAFMLISVSGCKENTDSDANYANTNNEEINGTESGGGEDEAQRYEIEVDEDVVEKFISNIGAIKGNGDIEKGTTVFTIKYGAGKNDSISGIVDKVLSGFDIIKLNVELKLIVEVQDENSISFTLRLVDGDGAIIEIFNMLQVDGDIYIGTKNITDVIMSVLGEFEEFEQMLESAELYTDEINSREWIRVGYDSEYVQQIISEYSQYNNSVVDIESISAIKEQLNDVITLIETIIKGVDSSKLNMFSMDNEYIILQINNDNVYDIISMVSSVVRENKEEIRDIINNISGEDTVTANDIELMASQYVTKDMMEAELPEFSIDWKNKENYNEIGLRVYGGEFDISVLMTIERDPSELEIIAPENYVNIDDMINELGSQDNDLQIGSSIYQDTDVVVRDESIIIDEGYAIDGIDGDEYFEDMQLEDPAEHFPHVADVTPIYTDESDSVEDGEYEVPREIIMN